MTQRSSRLLKKIHRRWLASVLIELSQNPDWRKRLFASAPGEVFAVSGEDTSGLSKKAAAAVCRYKLHFAVQKVDATEAEPWIAEGGSVIFKFCATAYPTLLAYSGNNPALVDTLPRSS